MSRLIVAESKLWAKRCTRDTAGRGAAAAHRVEVLQSDSPLHGPHREACPVGGRPDDPRLVPERRLLPRCRLSRLQTAATGKVSHTNNERPESYTALYSRAVSLWMPIATKGAGAQSRRFLEAHWLRIAGGSHPACSRHTSPSSMPVCYTLAVPLWPSKADVVLARKCRHPQLASRSGKKAAGATPPSTLHHLPPANTAPLQMAWPGGTGRHPRSWTAE